MKLSDFPLSPSPPIAADTFVGVVGGNTDVRFSFSQLSQLRRTIQTTNYVLALADAGGWIEMNLAAPGTLTIPPNASVAFLLNTVITVVQFGVGAITLVPGAGVTILSSGGALTTNGQYSNVMFYKRGTDQWLALGALT